MNLTIRGKIFILIAFLSFAFAYLITTLSYFPHFGMSLSLLTFTLFSYRFVKKSTHETKIYFIFTILFALLIFIRSNPFTTFLNLSATLFFGSLMLTNTGKLRTGILDYTYSPVALIFKSIFTKSEYTLEATNNNASDNAKNANFIFGILLSAIILVVVLPLLSSANPIFGKVIENLFNYLNFNNLEMETLFILSLRFMFFLAFLFIIPKILTLLNKTADYKFPFSVNIGSFTLTIPKIILGLVLILFFVSEFQLYFASEEYLSSYGISYSQRAREVFAQLSVVAGIVFLLLYNDRNYKKIDKIVNWSLGLEGVFLTLMAYRSAFEYINAWGLTYIRLYGVTVASLILGIFVIYFIGYLTKKPLSLFAKYALIYSGFVLLMANLINFDYLIYHYNKASTGQGIDYTYMSGLSADSLSYRDQFLKLEEVTKNNNYLESGYDNQNPLLLLYKIDNLQEKYSKFDIRTFNVLDYLQYRDIKDIDTSKISVTW